jgi:nicotinamide phosphoribosyltransferase
MNPFLLTDFYKVGHVFQYPKDTRYVYSNLTPRKSRDPRIDKMVFFGLQYFTKKY